MAKIAEPPVKSRDTAIFSSNNCQRQDFTIILFKSQCLSCHKRLPCAKLFFSPAKQLFYLLMQKCRNTFFNSVPQHFYVKSCQSSDFFIHLIFIHQKQPCNLPGIFRYPGVWQLNNRKSTCRPYKTCFFCVKFYVFMYVIFCYCVV